MFKKGFYVLSAVLLMVFFSCASFEDDNEPSDKGDKVSEVKTLDIITKSNDDAVYFSFSAGIVENAEPASIVWDIRFPGDDNKFTTNGGDTALSYGSQGKTAVEFTGSDDFENAAIDYRTLTFEGEFKSDKNVWWHAMGAKNGSLNIMTFYGYETGNGQTEETRYTTIANNKIAYCDSLSKGAFKITNRVYIIRHADGKKYSKFQVTGYEKVGDTRVYQIKYQNLN